MSFARRQTQALMNGDTTTHLSFGAPARYIQGPGTLSQLPLLLDEFKSTRALVVADDFVRQLLSEAVPALQGLRWHVFAGECTAAEVERVAQSFRNGDCDLIVGAGGGKSIDAAKGAQIALDCPVFIVPTVASTDAPTSRVAVLYTVDHRLAEVRAMRANPDVVLVDTAVLARAPRRFFVSGLGDALSKKFEMGQCMEAGGVNFYKGRQGQLTKLIGETCFSTLMADTADALAAVEAKAPNAAFERVLEATILLSGLAFENGGLSVAHSLTRGLSAIPAIHGSLHGEEVAFGLLVQLQLERDVQQAMLDQLRPYYRMTGLPASLQALGVPANELAEAAMKIAEVTVATSPHLKHFSRTLGARELADAILATSQA
ncbi:glycerol dehydrogenase [Variovorax robiniae]|uniref:Glycerol dehydrogenase n=1 Tax=Variovorax robiniae TaxID=1836199 RepID=A0ABU8XGI7_9BURK